MKMKNRMLSQKKGLDYYTVIVAVVGIFILSFIVFTLFTKEQGLGKGIPLGTDQLRILKTYSTAEKPLLFIDEAAKLALGQAAYKWGQSSFLLNDPECERVMSGPAPPSGGITAYWARDFVRPEKDCVHEQFKCYPEAAERKNSLSGFFGAALGGYVNSFNALSSVKLPFSYAFDFSPAGGKTEVKGISSVPVTVTDTNIKYEVKPNFRESISPDIISDGENVVAAAKSLTEKPKEYSDRYVADRKDASLKWDYINPYQEESKTCDDVQDACSKSCTRTCEVPCPKPEEPENPEKQPPGESGGLILADVNFAAEPPIVPPEVCYGECAGRCSGNLIQTTHYKETSSSYSVSTGQKYLVNGPPLAYQELTYNFALDWITMGEKDPPRCECNSECR